MKYTGAPVVIAPDELLAVIATQYLVPAVSAVRLTVAGWKVESV